MSTPWRPTPPSCPAATLSQIPIARPRSTSPHPSEKQQIGKSPAGMEGLDVDDVYQHYRLDPTEVEAVTYYLPRLISGETLHGAEKLIHRVDIYGCEPKDLAARFAPVPQAVSSGDRFFFTTCKSKNGSKTQSVRSAGGGTWTIQKTSEIGHAGGKVGEVKNLSFKKKGKSTGWVMEEYRCLLPEATVTDGVKVFCKIHLAQHPPDAARQESAAYKRQEGQPEPVAASTRAQKRPAPQPEHVQKRPALAAAADPHRPDPKKRMRVAVPVLAPATPSFTAAATVSLPAESIPEADDDMGRFSCSMEELLGVQVEETLTVGATNNIGQSFYFEPEEPHKLLADAAEEIVGTYHAAADLHAPFEAEWQAEEEAVPLKAEENIEQSCYSEPDELQLLLAMIDEATAEQQRQAVSTNDESSMADEAQGKDDAASDLHPPLLQGHDHLFESRPCFFDPFEAAWKAEEALENENLYAGPLRGHNNFFSSASVH